MQSFTGFPGGKLSFTAVPDVFFAELLPHIDDLAELKVTLHLMWLMHRRKPNARWVSLAELREDGVLAFSLAAAYEEPPAALEHGLRKAVERGTLLELRGGPAAQHAGTAERVTWYVLNSAKGRELLERVRTGALRLPAGEQPLPERPVPDRLGIFALYEQNIGPLQPIIADELAEAETLYPVDWVTDAFRIAAENNARNWRYIRSILERWHRQGKDITEQGDERDRKRFISGEYEQYLRG
jgi:DNA replication protein